MDNMCEITLRELCRRTGISRRAIQGYEKYHLISPSGKTNRGYLLYDLQALKRAEEIHAFQEYGFALKEIQAFYKSEKESRIEVLENKLKTLKERHKRDEVHIKNLTKTIRKLKTGYDGCASHL